MFNCSNIDLINFQEELINLMTMCNVTTQTSLQPGHGVTINDLNNPLCLTERYFASIKWVFIRK